MFIRGLNGSKRWNLRYRIDCRYQHILLSALGGLFLFQPKSLTSSGSKTFAYVSRQFCNFQIGWRPRIPKLDRVIRQQPKILFVRIPKRFYLINQTQQIGEVVNFLEIDIRFHETRFDIFFHALLCEETCGIIIRIFTRSDLSVQRPPIILSLLNPLTRERLRRGLCPFQRFRARKNRLVSSVFSILQVCEPWYQLEI